MHLCVLENHLPSVCICHYLFVDNDVVKTQNLKWVLSCFEQISGMKINYNKSELIPINTMDDELLPFLDILGCSTWQFPIKYLGIPLHYDKLRREDIQSLIDKIMNRMTGWRGKLLSYRGRLILTQDYLASIPI